MNLAIKHYSFDLWLTIIKSNPIFKKERAIFFHKNFNFNNQSLEFIEKVFRNVDLMCNAINEKTGGNIDSEEMYLMVLYQINNSYNCFQNIDLTDLYLKIELLVFEYSPILFDKNTFSVLEKLKQNNDVSLNILSNTAFIKGSTLKIILDNLNVSQYFDFQIYSDEVGFSKPNPKLFSLLTDEIKQCRKDLILTKNQIMHIGDNEIADIQGAKTAGLETFLINSNNKNILNILD